MGEWFHAQKPTLEWLDVYKPCIVHGSNFVANLDFCLVFLLTKSNIFSNFVLNQNCCNLSLRLATEAKAYKSGRQEAGPRGTSYAPGSARECERINPHTFKATFIWGIRVPMDSWIFREQLQGSKPIGLRSFLYHWKAIET